MKRIVFFIGIFLLFLTSCKKELNTLTLEQQLNKAVANRHLPDTSKQITTLIDPDWIVLNRPENIDIYSHFENYAPTISIDKGTKSPLILPENFSNTIGEKILTSSYFKNETTLNNICENKEVNGVIILYKGEIVYEKYPNIEPTDRHVIASISKTFIGTVIAHLADKGQLHELDAISKYIPELKNTELENITIEHLLRMASGINCIEHLPNMESYINPDQCFYKILEHSGLYSEPKEGFSTSLLNIFIQSGTYQEPGITYDYTGVNSVLLAMIAERITKTPYHQLVSSIIWSNIGAEANARITMSSEGVSGSYGTMLVRLRDLARYGLAFTDDAPKKIASDRYLEQIRTGDTLLFLSEGGTGKNYWSKEYEGQGAQFQSYQWDIIFDDGDFIKFGFGGQALYISPDKRLVIAFYSAGKDKTFNHYNLRFLVRSLALLDEFNME